jgi:aminocarboxymuconate-semialdehyde decarboxylase
MRIALDVHAHLAPGIPAGASDVEVGSPALFQRGALRGWMDEHGVERSWISIPPPLYRPQLHEAAAREWCVYVNEGLADLADARLQPLFHLPLEHPSVSLELAQRFSGAGAGFSVPAGGLNVACFSDQRLAPLWTLLDVQRSFVFVHPGSCCDGRLAVHYLEKPARQPLRNHAGNRPSGFQRPARALSAHPFLLRARRRHGGDAGGPLATRV